MSKALVCLYHRSSSIGEYSFIVLFLTCLPRQQLVAFSFEIESLGPPLSVQYSRSFYFVGHRISEQVIMIVNSRITNSKLNEIMVLSSFDGWDENLRIDHWNADTPPPF